ncbi:phage tail assembly chaperone [Sphingomonas sp. PB2P19]|uniref:phage tail assembly chaperone n=1 Tax=Sphingomonas rhamnosi TaxID=3096156 RepID=UPI002FCC5296
MAEIFADSAFSERAGRLAGFAGAVLGWSPDAFWRATPAELAAVAGALNGGQAPPPGADVLARLREAFPDG